METIASFKIDHTKLEPGLYLSRLDDFNGHKVTTFDIRMTTPNEEPAMDSAAMHTIEHLAATWFRNSEIKDSVIYVGMMSCCTGMYIVLSGQWSVTDILEYVKSMFKFIRGHSDKIPGATEKECGNYLHHNLPMAKYYSNKWLSYMRISPSIKYPE